MNLIHKNLTLEKWSQLSIFEQLANVACDIERTINWRNRGELEFSKNAFERALELLTLTIMDPKNKGPRRKELGRVRETLIDYFVYDNIYKSNDQVWQNYFYQFSYAAGLERERKRNKNLS